MLKKKEIFIQDAVSKCGACSIASIISHYNGYVPLETIIDDTFTDKNGTNAYQIVQTLQKYGFISYGMKTSLSKINIFPVIAHVLKNGLEHFLVIYDIKKGHVITMDPECGEKQYLIEEFEKYFSGNVIFCNPTNNIIKYEKNKKFQKEIKCGIKKQKKLVLLFIILSAILIFINIFYSFYLKIAEVNNNIFNITLLFIIILNIKFLMSYFINYIQIKIIINVDELLNNKFLNHIFAIKVLSLYNKRSGDIIKKIGDMNLVKDFIIKILLSFVSNAILFCLGVIILTIYNFQLGIVFLIMALLYVVISIVISKKLYKQNLENNLKHSNYMGILTESVNNIITIKNLNVTSHFKNKINFTYDEYLYSTRSLSRNINKINNTTSFIKEFTILIVNFIGIISINNGLGNIVDLFTFNTLIIVIYDALENLVSFYPEYLRFKAVFRASSEFLDIKHENISEETLETFECLKIVNLTYSYDGYKNTINNLNLDIKKGDKIFITGPSGIGKSTLIKCISGICENYNGSIKYNDLEIKEIPINVLRKNIVYIGQDEQLFSTSIKENITFGKEGQMDEIYKICKLDAVINSRTLKEEYVVLENATNLSKGEKARIMLARALYLKPQILIIDETLSNLNEKMENGILVNLLKKDELTLIYISHRNKKHYFNKEIKFREDGKYEIRK